MLAIFDLTHAQEAVFWPAFVAVCCLTIMFRLLGENEPDE